MAVAVAGAALAPTAQARRVRVFAVGPRFELSWVQSPETFRAKLLALMDRRRRGGGAPPVQRGVDDVASHRLGPDDRRRPAGSARDLVVMPEDLGLFAGLTGSRGAAARAVTADTGGLVAALTTLFSSYSSVIGHYAARFPDLLGRGLPARLLGVALTDTFARTAVETYAKLADRYDVWLAAGVNMARRWRIVCVDKARFRPPPGASRCDVQDPALVARLRSPDEPTRDYAYEATDERFSNMALVFDPNGRLVSRQVKEYLTAIELPGNLDLAPGAVSSGVHALRTPVGTLGFVTSKDAWMPDLIAKLDQEGVDLLVQPEFFAGDTVSAAGMWPPDTLKAAGYSDVLRSPGIEAMALPELTGNIYDLAADAQQHIVVKPRGRRVPRGYLVGQRPAPGFAAVAPWVVPDPLAPGEPIATRRARLRRAAQALLPVGGGPPCPSPRVPGPCKGGQVESMLWRDVEVARRPRYRPRRRAKLGATPFTVNRPLAPSRSSQRNVSLAARGSKAWAAFEQRRGGRARIVLVRSRDGGRTWSAPLSPAGGRPGRAREWWPSVAAGPGGRVWVAWQDDGTGVPRAYVAVSRDGGRSFAPARAIDASPPPGVAQWRPSIAATGRTSAVVAWIDERERSPDDDLPQAHVFAARLRGDGSAAGTATRLDTAAPVELAAKLDNAWAPDVTARAGRVAVAWVDFRSYDWRPYLRESSDGGGSWGPERPLSDAPLPSPENAEESLDDAPSVALGPDGPRVAWVDFRKRASSARRPHQLYDVYLGSPGRASAQVDPWGSGQLDSFNPAAVLARGGGLLVAWQDAARGISDVRLRRVDAAGRVSGGSVLVDDRGAGTTNAWRPALATLGGDRVLAAWEDERDGPRQIFAATASAASVR